MILFEPLKNEVILFVPEPLQNIKLYSFLGEGPLFVFYFFSFSPYLFQLFWCTILQMNNFFLQYNTTDLYAAFLHSSFYWVAQSTEVDRYIDRPAVLPAVAGFMTGFLYKSTSGIRVKA